MEIHRYQLRLRGVPNAHATNCVVDGALVREDSGVACLQPWPALGDAPLERQLKAIAAEDATPLVAATRLALQRDASWRAQGISAFDIVGPIPPSHATLLTPNLEAVEHAADGGFQLAKVKGSLIVLGELTRLLEETPIPLRVDFNETLTPEETRSFLRELSPQGRENLDFLEDPCAYDPVSWTSLHEDTGCRLALDRQSKRASEGGFQVLVVKPAIDDLDQIERLLESSDLPFVVTSYMDHPVGQLHAAYQAARLAQRFPTRCEPCGLATHHLFEELVIADRLGNGPRLGVPQGSGIGLDDYLNSLRWSSHST